MTGRVVRAAVAVGGAASAVIVAVAVDELYGWLRAGGPTARAASVVSAVVALATCCYVVASYIAELVADARPRPADRPPAPPSRPASPSHSESNER